VVAEAERPIRCWPARLGDCGGGNFDGRGAGARVAMRHRSVVGVIMREPEGCARVGRHHHRRAGLLEDGMEQLPEESDIASDVWSSSLSRHAARTAAVDVDGLSALDDRCPRATPRS